MPDYIQQLITVYQKAQENLVRIIAEKEAKGSVALYQKSLLAQVNAELQKLNKQAKQWANTAIPASYHEGIDLVNSDLKKMGLNISVSKSFSKLHTRAVEVLVENAYGTLQDANNFVGRRIHDVVRQAGIDAVTQKMAQGATVRQCKKNIVDALVKEGIRMISLDAYAATVARSTTAEATNKAILNQLTELGYDLVKMTEHSTSCPICLPLQGRVYSISGKDKRYPPLETAYSGPYANIHPNCRHRLVPYIEALADDPEGDRERSNRPFEVEPKAKKQLDRYNRIQKEKQQLRADRNQWQRYRLVLPNDTPKTFSAFRAMKKANSEKWLRLQEDYKKSLYIIRKNNVLKWPENFPNVVAHTSVANLKSEKNGNRELYKLAKAGDQDAGFELVKKVLKPEKVQWVSDYIEGKRNVVIVPVVSIERTGYNVLPEQYAIILGHYIKRDVYDKIFQKNKAFHTGSSAMHRILSRSQFDGEVIKGYNYVIVDDVMTMGGTLADLRKYIELNGGNVILASTLAHIGQTRLAITDDLINKLHNKFGLGQLDALLREEGVANGIEELTYAEGYQLLKFRDVDRIRDRILEEKNRRN